MNHPVFYLRGGRNCIARRIVTHLFFLEFDDTRTVKKPTIRIYSNKIYLNTIMVPKIVPLSYRILVRRLGRSVGNGRNIHTRLDEIRGSFVEGWSETSLKTGRPGEKFTAIKVNVLESISVSRGEQSHRGGGESVAKAGRSDATQRCTILSRKTANRLQTSRH